MDVRTVILCLILAAAGEPTKRLTVQRGCKVDLRPAIAPSPRNCSVRYIAVPGLSCGSVSPSEFSCDYTGTVEYHHYGCFANYELVHFQRSALPSNDSETATVELFSVEIHVEDFQSPAVVNISVRLFKARPSGYLISLIFPASSVGACQYEISSGDPMVPIPISGKLDGTVNQPLPCGFVAPLQLSNVSHIVDRDYLLVRVRVFSDDLPDVVNVMLPLDFTEVSGSIPKQLSTKHLTVAQVTVTPIYPNMLPNYTEIPHKYIFPVHSAGTFCPVHSPCTDVPYTVFTAADLSAGLVAFIPNEGYVNSSVTYDYSVTDFAGSLLALGRIRVYVAIRDWSRPSQRTNNGLTVTQGTSTPLDSSSLDFYVLPKCRLISHLSLLQVPLHGNFAYLNGSWPDTATVQLGSVKNSTIQYMHSGDGSIADRAVWELSCTFGAPLLVFLSIRIAPLEAVFPPLPYSLSLTAYQHLAMPLTLQAQALPPNTQLRFDGYNGTLVRVKNLKTLLSKRDAFFPYVKVSTIRQVTLSDVQECSLSEIHEQTIWYIPRQTVNNSDMLEFTVNDTPRRHYLTVSITLDPLSNDLMLSTASDYPELLYNSPLPLHAHSNVFITARQLYTSALASPANSILYVVRVNPQHGRLCLLSPHKCSSSVQQFTQREINLQRLFYMPTGDIDRNDSFHFVVTINGVKSYHEMQHQFQITATAPTIVAGKQLWINVGKKKRVAAKYLRPYTKPFSTKNNKDLVFRVTSGPAYGELVVNKTGSFFPYPNFTFGDAVDQKVWYYHGAGWGTHCSDLILFTVTNGKQEVNGSLLIAVKQSLDIYLGAKTTPRGLFGQTSFILSSDDLSAISPFCPEFVTYTIDSEPSKGVITLYNARHKTVQQLGVHGTFTEADIQSGFVRYSINDPTNLTHNSSDGFHFNLSDPRTSNHMDLALRVSGQTPVHHFSVLIWRSSDEIYNVSIDIASPQPLTWLHEHSVYGYLFSTDAIRVHSDDIRSSDVVIIITQRPRSGTFKRNNTEVVHFTLDQVQAGLVWFESTLRNFHRNFNDMFLFSILIESLKVHVLLNQVFSLEWSTVQLEEKRYVTQETAGSLEITIRRDGPNWFESRVLLTTQPNNATPATNCSSPDADTDYCSLLVEVVFLPGETRATQNVSIIDDSIAEGPESLILTLLNPNSTIIREAYNTATVIITDQSDYSLIGFRGSRPQYDPRRCQLEVTAREQGGTLAINLTRSGNVDKPVSVICYTEPDTSDHADFVPRTNSHESLVVFGPNETVAQCLVEIVDDDENEINEKFVVRLGQTVGLARVDHSSTPLCVFIVYDEHDAPVVSFNTSEIIVQESENGDVHAAFEIRREGSDLAFPTTVTYATVILVGDKADPEVDYSLSSTGEWGVETDGVIFEGGQMSLLRSVTIHHDRVKESNETFHVHIREVHNGRKGERQLLRITIIDGTKPAKVSFVAPEFQFEETHTAVQVRFQRLCYTAGETSVSCILKWGTADSDDFYVPDEPEVVVVPAGETDGVCNIYILDDPVREGPETFTVRLVSSEVGVVFTNTSVATVFIKDPEDVPVVGFSSPSYEVQEPLSNFPPDVTHVLLTVTRTGDINRTSTVSFSTEQVTATAGEDFLATSGTITFQPGEILANLTVQVLANHASELNRQFYVEITANTTPHHEVNTDPQRYRAIINVTHQPVKGVYFPDLPILASLHNNTFSATHLFHDLPLLCITPCDSDYSTVVGNTDYSSECERQQIDPTLTEYTWELSTDGTHFSKLHLETAFTSTEDKVLESLYLQHGLYVQCTAWAVDSFSRKSYNRTSEAILLTAAYASHCDSYNAEGITVYLSSYPDFTATNEDLLHLSITLPHIPNAIPLVSTYPMESEALLTHPPAQSCVDPGNSLLQLVETLRKPQSLQLYNHLNTLTCQWTFETWLPLMTLIDNCSANMNNSSTISVSIYAAYVHVMVDNTISTVHTHTTNASLHVDSSASSLTVPVITYPSRRDPDSYIYPIAAQYNASNLQLYIYSTALFSGEFTAPHGSSTTLLYSTTTEEGRRQAWMVDMVVKDTAMVSVELDPCFSEGSAQTCIRRLPSYVFTLHLSFTPLSLMALTLGTLKHNLTSPANMREPFAYGDTVYGMVSLNATQQLRTDFSLVITRVLLCSSASGRTPVYNPQLMHYGCSTSYPSVHILDVDAHVNSSTMFDASFLSQTVFQFKTDTLYQNYSSPWYVHITHDVRSRDHPGAEQHIILQLLLQPVDENATLSSSSTSPSPNDLIPLIYTAIAIAISALSLVLLVCSVSAVMYWMWQAKKRLLHRSPPLQKELKNSEKPVYNIMSGSVEPRIYDLRRTTSTTGFPTAEHYRRPTHKKTPQQTLTRSRSLPNLSLLANQQPRARIIPERRRILRTPLTTIKVLNTALPNQKHLRAYKPVIKVIQNDLGKRQLGRRHTNGTELASYAVRSLATSAMTPEPGSKPITEL